MLWKWRVQKCTSSDWLTSDSWPCFTLVTSIQIPSLDRVGDQVPKTSVTQGNNSWVKNYFDFLFLKNAVQLLMWNIALSRIILYSETQWKTRFLTTPLIKPWWCGFYLSSLGCVCHKLSSKYLKSWKWSEATSCAHTIRAKMCFLYIAGYVSEPTFFYTGCFASAETVRFRIILSLLLRKQQKQCCLHFNLFSSVIHSWHRWATLIWFKVNSVIIYCFNEI